MNSYIAIAALFAIFAVFFLLVGSMVQHDLFWTGLVGVVLGGAIVLFQARR